jgi:hypothetical protein
LLSTLYLWLTFSATSGPDTALVARNRMCRGLGYRNAHSDPATCESAPPSDHECPATSESAPPRTHSEVCGAPPVVLAGLFRRSCYIFKCAQIGVNSRISHSDTVRGLLSTSNSVILAPRAVSSQLPCTEGVCVHWRACNRCAGPYKVLIGICCRVVVTHYVKIL